MSGDELLVRILVCLAVIGEVTILFIRKGWLK